MADIIETLIEGEKTTPRESSTPVAFVESCPKCHGTGRYRHLGPCFMCKGAGRRTFKKSAGERAVGRAEYAAKKVKTAEQNLADFAAFEPKIWAWIDGNDYHFAKAMRDAVEKYGNLTLNQKAACERSIEKLAASKAAAVDRKENAPVVEMTHIDAAFARASARLKKPRLTIANISFAPAPASGSNAGAIYVKSGSQYLGKISGGKFVTVRDTTAEQRAKVLEVAADPKAAAIAHGRVSGRCAICSRVLTDANSVAAGIGPICAEGFGW